MAGGVAWGLLCVGVRVVAVDLGGKMNGLVAKRNELIARTQYARERLDEVRQLEQMEKRAAELGFVKLGQAHIIIVPPPESAGFFARIFGSHNAPPPPAISPPPPDNGAKTPKKTAGKLRHAAKGGGRR